MGSLWNRSGTIERYGDDLRADGARAFFFQGGTTTPMSVYADANQSDAFPHPLEADANGRWPDVFVPYVANFDVRVESKFGETLSFSQRIPNPDPVQQTVVVPPERQVNTGAICPEFTSGPKSGYVRLNGKTIGDGTTSGANSERANDDCLDLFRYLWNNTINDVFPVLPGGKGASADADFTVAHKTITLPDMRGAALAGLDDMGNAPAGNFGTLPFTLGNSIIVGSILGTNGITLTIENVPAHTHTGSTAVGTPPTHTHSGTASGAGSGGTTSTGGHNHSVSISGSTGTDTPDHTHNYGSGDLGGVTGGGGAIGAGASRESGGANSRHTHSVSGTGGTTSTGDHNHNVSVSVSVTIPPDGSHTHTFTTDSKGGEGNPAVTRPFNNMPITRLVTWYIKL